MENNKKNIFETLSAINVNSMVEKKQTGNTMLTYLSWASAWAVAKANFPDIEYEIERNPETNLPYWYDPLTGYMVFTKITLDGQSHEMFLPVMDGTNHAMKAEPYTYDTKYKKGLQVNAATMTDINKTIMRCLVKNLAMFGLGLYIYQGEDLPSSVEHSYPIQAQPAQPVEKAVQKSAQSQVPVKKDTRLITAEMVDIIRKIVGEHGVTGDFVDFICESYKVCKLEDLRIYQFNHIKQNIEKLKTMFDAKRKKRLADITVDPAAVKPKDMGTTFADVIAPPQQEKAEGEEVSLESLGLSPADLDALTECGNVFN